jgi:poly(3-hydroxyalkanoate) synthetase
LLQSYLTAFGGLAPGEHRRAVWTRASLDATAREALQREPTPALQAAFDRWNSFTLALPGPFLTQTTDWLFRENRLARGSFCGLGRTCDLSAIETPIFLLMARSDTVIPPPQTLAIKNLCVRAPIRAWMAAGVHLSLFMGADMLEGPWRQIAADLAKTLAPPSASAARMKARSPLTRSQCARSHAPGAW